MKRLKHTNRVRLSSLIPAVIFPAALFLGACASSEPTQSVETEREITKVAQPGESSQERDETVKIIVE